jgi:hypothetical protein
MMGGGGDDGDGMEITLMHERQAEFPHPSLKESLVEIPSYVEINRGHTPFTLIKPEELALNYEHKVCSLMDFPHLFFRPNGNLVGGGGAKSSIKGSGSGNGNLLSAQSQLEDSVCKQQEIFEQIFIELYSRTLARMDALLFATKMPEELRYMVPHITVRMKFDNQVKKSDEAVQSLLSFYEKGIITFDEMRAKTVHNYGIPVDGEGKTATKPKPKTRTNKKEESVEEESSDEEVRKEKQKKKKKKDEKSEAKEESEQKKKKKKKGEKKEGDKKRKRDDKDKDEK